MTGEPFERLTLTGTTYQNQFHSMVRTETKRLANERFESTYRAEETPNRRFTRPHNTTSNA